MSLVVVDYCRGNLFSLGEALRHLNAAFSVSADPAVIAAATRLILPGVGAFGDCMQGLRDRGLIAPLNEAVRNNRTPFLGICVGMQIMATSGEEFGDHDGLGFVGGKVRRLASAGDQWGKLRVPNVGWRTLNPVRDDPVVGDIPNGTMTYFVHSYTFQPDEPTHVAAAFDFNGNKITAIVHDAHMLGFQFHPEKSGPAGLDLINRFLNMRSRAN